MSSSRNRVSPPGILTPFNQPRWTQLARVFGWTPRRSAASARRSTFGLVGVAVAMNLLRTVDRTIRRVGANVQSVPFSSYVAYMLDVRFVSTRQHRLLSLADGHPKASFGS